MLTRSGLIRQRPVLAALLLIGALVVPSQVLGSLNLLRPTPSSPATFFGHGGVSTDGWSGSFGQTGALQAEVPAGSTIEQAYLYAAGIPAAYSDSPVASVALEGAAVSMTTIINDSSGTLSRADVTATVSAKVGSGGGVTDFAVVDPVGAQGVALVVIYSNASQPERTVALLDGGALPTGDEVTFHFADPLDTTIPDFDATLALGITFSYQGDGHVCGSGQISYVDVNGQRVSSCAGSFDDGIGANGSLLTVGGVGDSTNNPPNPNGAGGEDDELYDLSPFLSNGDASVTVSSYNPTNNDYIFLAVIAITAQAQVTGPGDPTPAPTPIATPTPTPTPTPTVTPTVSPSSPATVSPVPTATPSPIATPTPTPSPSVTPALTVKRASLQTTDHIAARVVNMLPNEPAKFYLNSEPVFLGTASADAHGVIEASFPLPEGVERGSHTLTVIGFDGDGEATELEAAITVSADGDGLPDTALAPQSGLAPLRWLGAVALILSAAVAWRRRKAV